MVFTLNSPEMYDDISSVMALSASVKLRASTTYCSMTFFCKSSSIVFSYCTLVSNHVEVLVLISVFF